MSITYKEREEPDYIAQSLELYHRLQKRLHAVSDEIRGFLQDLLGNSINVLHAVQAFADRGIPLEGIFSDGIATAKETHELISLLLSEAHLEEDVKSFYHPIKTENYITEATTKEGTVEDFRDHLRWRTLSRRAPSILQQYKSLTAILPASLENGLHTLGNTVSEIIGIFDSYEINYKLFLRLIEMLPYSLEEILDATETLLQQLLNDQQVSPNIFRILEMYKFDPLTAVIESAKHIKKSNKPLQRVA